MKILALHVDYINFKPLKKAIKNIADLQEEEKEEKKVGESLVILTAVEKGDAVKETVKKLIENVEDIAKQVNAKTVVLYPYAHLSSNLAPPDVAEETLKEAEKELKKKFKVIRAPFGYYKEFELKVKGHPLSELSREIKAELSHPGEKGKKEAENYDPKNFLHEIKQSKLDTSKLKDNDHRIIGQEMDLFMLNQSSPGMVYWLPNGTIIYNELIRFWREEHKKRGYQETITPLINKSALYKVSGHWAHYKEHMFVANTEEGEYGIKAMNCPNAMVIFGSKSRSYKELPLRLSDTDRLHRYELSGTLGGLLRVRSFQQDDSHNFVTEEQIEEEYNEIFDITELFYNTFKMNHKYTLSLRKKGSKEFMGDEKTWENAEKMLRKILDKKIGKGKYKVAEGEGAFYGPKVDIMMEDSMGREWQMGTIQLDMQMPLRFGLKYVDQNNKEKTPICIHRVIYGSLERFIAILLEHTNGRLPTWLAPIQVRILSFTDRNIDYAKRIVKQLGENVPGIRLDADFQSTTVQSKVKNAEVMRIPYIILIGDKEEKEGTLAVRVKGNNEIKTMKFWDFANFLNKEIEERR